MRHTLSRDQIAKGREALAEYENAKAAIEAVPQPASNELIWAHDQAWTRLNQIIGMPIVEFQKML